MHFRRYQNDEYENFINAHMEVAAECIQTKLRAKHRVSWETLTVKTRFDDMNTTSLCKERNPINANAQKLKKAQSELTNAYLEEQTEYIQDLMNKIRHLFEDRLSWIVWKTVNKVSKIKSTMGVKLKAASQEEWIHLWKKHFKNLFGKSPKVMDHQNYW